MSITKIKAPLNKSQANKPSGSSEPAIGLDNRARKEVVECLTHTLADTYLLQVKTQYYHWNVTGPQFSSLHLLFEAQYNALFAAVDEYAERIRTLGAFSPGTFREFEALSTIKEDKSLPENATAMVKNLLEANEAVARRIRQALGDIEDSGDEGTKDLFVRRIQEHEKAAWMLRSYLQ
jgi:starvation-inducible DNA-binding protein